VNSIFQIQAVIYLFRNSTYKIKGTLNLNLKTLKDDLKENTNIFLGVVRLG
jgi:hypothetical protein